MLPATTTPLRDLPMDAIGKQLSNLTDEIDEWARFSFFDQCRHPEVSDLIRLLQQRAMVLCQLADLAEAGDVEAVVIGMDLAAAGDKHRADQLEHAAELAAAKGRTRPGRCDHGKSKPRRRGIKALLGRQ